MVIVSKFGTSIFIDMNWVIDVAIVAICVSPIREYSFDLIEFIG